MQSEKEIRNPVWLKLSGHRVVALKPEFGEHAVELESAIQRGIPAYPDLARADFYDVALEEGWAYIHVYRAGHLVYLVADFLSTSRSFSTGDSKTDSVETHDPQITRNGHFTSVFSASC